MCDDRQNLECRVAPLLGMISDCIHAVCDVCALQEDEHDEPLPCVTICGTWSIVMCDLRGGYREVVSARGNGDLSLERCTFASEEPVKQGGWEFMKDAYEEVFPEMRRKSEGWRHKGESRHRKRHDVFEGKKSESGEEGGHREKVQERLRRDRDVSGGAGGSDDDDGDERLGALRPKRKRNKSVLGSGGDDSSMDDDDSGGIKLHSARWKGNESVLGSGDADSGMDDADPGESAQHSARKGGYKSVSGSGDADIEMDHSDSGGKDWHLKRPKSVPGSAGALAKVHRSDMGGVEKKKGLHLPRQNESGTGNASTEETVWYSIHDPVRCDLAFEKT